jgi:hypothetical protein
MDLLPARIEAMLARALRYGADGHGLPLVCMALSFAGTVSAAYPVTAIVVPATLLAATRWRSVSLFSALGSALGAITLMLVFHHLGWAQLYERFPELALNESWSRVLRWASAYGAITLFFIAVSPLPQTPALIFFGAVRHDYAGVFVAMLSGKLIKYALFAWTTSRLPRGSATLRIGSRSDWWGLRTLLRKRGRVPDAGPPVPPDR